MHSKQLACLRDDLKGVFASLGALLVVTRCDIVSPDESFACSRKRTNKSSPVRTCQSTWSTPTHSADTPPHTYPLGSYTLGTSCAVHVYDGGRPTL